MPILRLSCVDRARRGRWWLGWSRWRWLSCFLSAVTLGEIQAGIELTREQDADKAAEIEAWLELVAAADNVLPMDGTVFRDWARLMYGRLDTLYKDAMVAATTRVNGLKVVTRNVADFEALAVEVFNPFGKAAR